MAAETGAPAGRAGLSQLPGFDTAPDVYETGDDDTVSTAQTHSPVPSEASDTSDEEEDEEDEDSYGVSRRRLYPAVARSRFGEQNRGLDVETRKVDLSDRVDGKRRGLKIRRREGGEVEGLEGKMARLKREIEECRVEAERERREAEQEGDGDGDGEGGVVDDCEALSRLLAGIDVLSTSATGKKKGHRRGGSVFHDAPTTALPPDAGDQERDGEVTHEQTLANVSAFDTRLSALETALGISSLETVTEPTSTSVPILPTLTLLDHQLATLTTATSLSSLEHVFTRIQKLKAEAHRLHQLQHQTLPAPDDDASPTQNGTTSPSSSSPTPPPFLSPIQTTHLTNLYTLLPHLTALAPTVPALIARLRSLRTLHASAAHASADLEAVEQRQTELEKELNMWREGLGKVEAAVREANEANGRNGNFVKGWVEELEGRVRGLGR